MVPQVPQHGGAPQDGRSYQPCDPGPAIGALLTVTTTYGVEEFPKCSFVGSEGIAEVSPSSGFRVLRFADAPYVLEAPSLIASDPSDNIDQWTFMSTNYQTLFVATAYKGTRFGAAAQLAHAKYWVPRFLEQVEAAPPLRVWGAPPRCVSLWKDSVEVTQFGRTDVVSSKDLAVSLQAGDLVLRATAFYEARYIVAELPNALHLFLMLKILGAASAD
jgi:hypothetical protein